MGFESDSLEDLVDLIEYSHILIFITNCNELIQNDGEQFANILERLLESTEYLKIILVTDVGDQMVQSEHYSNTITIEPLDAVYAAKLLLRLDKKENILRNKDLKELCQHQLFKG